jgi:hypothetical protein
MVGFLYLTQQSIAVNNNLNKIHWPRQTSRSVLAVGKKPAGILSAQGKTKKGSRCKARHRPIVLYRKGRVV